MTEAVKAIGEYVLKLLPSILAVLNADGPENVTIASTKLAADAARLKNDHDLANKRYPESSL